MDPSFDLSKYGITNSRIHRNWSIARLYQAALLMPDRYHVASSGALIAYSGEKTGRSPKEKRIVLEDSTRGDIWWGDINIPVDEDVFDIAFDSAINFLNLRPQTFVVDGYACWDPENRIKIRIICARAYHALFMRNMLIRPTDEEVENYGEPDWVIFNAGMSKVSSHLKGLTSDTSVQINFDKKQMVILGTEYAGEMKKGIFTVLNYELPKKGVLSMHCSANEGARGDTALFFGLSGTGKTTLSADPKRALIGDDEHGWSEDGIFNIEGGCYAKVINLSQEKEPQIYSAIRFGAVLENVVFDQTTCEVDYDDNEFTENTRAAYPVDFIENAKIPCVGGHPRNIIFLTCDAFGVLPPVSRLTPGQAMYHFISGYTAKAAGTEVGITEPQPIFSACFGAAFLVWHPTKYAEMLKEKLRRHDATVWMVNTGWTGGAYGVGSRFELKYTRAIIDAILGGGLENVYFESEPNFGLAIPRECANVPSEALIPRNAWEDKESYDATVRRLAGMFHNNFEQYADKATTEIINGGPLVK